MNYIILRHTNYEVGMYVYGYGYPHNRLRCIKINCDKTDKQF